MTSLLEPVEKRVVTFKKALAQLDACTREVSGQETAIADNIHSTFGQLKELLTVRETELISELEERTQEKLKGLAAQKDQIEITLAQLDSCLHFVKESLKGGNEGDVLTMKTNTVRQVKEISISCEPDTFEHNTETDFAFSASADMTGMCQNYGKIFASASPDPSKCHFACKVTAAVGEKCVATLQAIDFEGKLCKESIKFLECIFVSEVTGTRTSCDVEKTGQSQYEISYQPTIKGRHFLHIKASNQHIRGSPFSVAVKSPVEKLSTPILTISRVVEPWGVTINRRGEVVVTDGDCVSVFSSSGEKLRSFFTHGSGPGQVWHPREVAEDGEGNILLVDSGNDRIQRFTSEGQYLTTIGTKGSGQLQFFLPTGIAFNFSSDKVYVTDTNNHRIQVLNSDLTFSSAFGKAGDGKGQFSV